MRKSSFHFPVSRRLFACVAATTLLVGCGGQSGLPRTVVVGKVTFGGKPVPNGEIRFHPMEGTPGPVSGGPIRDGNYEAKAGGGVPLGKHRVEIQAFRTGKDFTNNPEGGPVEQYLPKQFNEQSELTASVDATTETLDFELKADPGK